MSLDVGGFLKALISILKVILFIQFSYVRKQFFTGKFIDHI